jgi:hypothetical protein
MDRGKSAVAQVGCYSIAPRCHYAMLLCCWVFQLSKSNKKARFLGRAVLESGFALDSTHPRRALDLSP